MPQYLSKPGPEGAETLSKPGRAQVRVNIEIVMDPLTMRAVKLNAQVTSDHTLHLDLPGDIAEGPAEVIVLVESPQATPARVETGSVAEFLSRPRLGDRFLRSLEEIDRDLRAERESWE